MTPQRAHRADPPTDAVADRNATPENDATRAPTDARTRAVRSNRGKSLGTQLTAGSGRKVWWVCPAGHAWEARVAHRTRGRGCPSCARRGRSNLPLDPALAAQWHPTKNGDLTPGAVTAGSDYRAWWICEAGHEWQVRVKARSQGTGCPVCSNRVRTRQPLDPVLAAQWHPTKNGDQTPEDVTAGSGQKVWWVCGQGHEWEATVVNRSHGTGCPRCARAPRPAATSRSGATP